MKLRTKTAVISLITTLGLVISLYAISARLILEKFLAIEKTSVERNVERAQSALEDAIDGLVIKLSDWAYWDDAYKFMKDGNQAFIESNLQPQAYANLEINLILFINPDRTLKYGNIFDLENQKEDKLSKEFYREISGYDSLFPAGGNEDYVHGVIATSSGPVFVAVRKILTSQATGQSRGYLLFGRFVDDRAIKRISDLAHLPVDSFRIDQQKVLDGHGDVFYPMIATDKKQVVVVSDTRIDGYGAVKTILNEPILALRVQNEREIYLQAIETQRSLLWLVLMAGTVFGLAVMLLLERAVISKVEVLGDQLGDIRTSRDHTLRVHAKGSDELSMLGRGINDVLEGLEIAHRENVQARNEAEAANRSKSEFVANMSHEIRTPLNGILGMTEVMLRTTKDPAVLDSAMIIRESGHYLLSIINEVLDFSKVEANKIVIEPIHFKAREFFESIFRTFDAIKSQKPVSISYTVDDALPDILCADPVRIRQIVTNLVGNALKFTEKGSVSVKIFEKENISQNLVLGIEVRDTGIGIPAEKLSTIFDAFSQADGSTSRKFGGTGLGLTITRRLAELMGGNIEVASTVGAGSVFRVTLAVSVGEEAKVEKISEIIPCDTKKSLRILVVDDVQTNRMVAKRLFELAGHNVELAVNGAQAIERRKEGGFDIIFMDIHMPEVDGFKATEVIREWEDSAHKIRVPIVAVSAHIVEDEQKRLLDLGIDGFAIKPLEVDKLNRIFNLVVHPLSEDSNASYHRGATVNRFDYSTFLERMGDDESIVMEVLDSFRSDSAIYLRRIVDAIESGNVQEISRAAHAIKGGLINCAAQSASEIAARLESITKDGDVSNAKELFEELHTAVVEFWQAVDDRISA